MAKKWNKQRIDRSKSYLCGKLLAHAQQNLMRYDVIDRTESAPRIELKQPKCLVYLNDQINFLPSKGY